MNSFVIEVMHWPSFLFSRHKQLSERCSEPPARRHVHWRVLVLALALQLAGASTAVQAQLRSLLNGQNGPLASLADWKGATVGHSIAPTVGTHVNGLAAQGRFGLRVPLERKPKVEWRFFARGGLGVYGQYYGLPGASIQGNYGFEAVRSRKTGRKVKHAVPFTLWTEGSRNWAYYYLWYFSSDGTTQSSGGVKFWHVHPRGTFLYTFENDWLGWRGIDEYRTGSIEAAYLWHRPRGPVGLGLNLTLWTGSVAGLPFLSRGETYDMEGQHGAEYSHGIAALKLYWGPFSLGLGYDSEVIRDVVQNNFHYLINDGYIPPLENRQPRYYVQLGLRTQHLMY